MTVKGTDGCVPSKAANLVRVTHGRRATRLKIRLRLVSATLDRKGSARESRTLSLEFPGRAVALVPARRKADPWSIGPPIRTNARINVRALVGSCNVWNHSDSCIWFDVCNTLLRVPRCEICLDRDDTSDEASA